MEYTLFLISTLATGKINSVCFVLYKYSSAVLLLHSIVDYVFIIIILKSVVCLTAIQCHCKTISRFLECRLQHKNAPQMPCSKVVADTSNIHTHTKNTAIQHGYDDKRQTMTNIHKRIFNKKKNKSQFSVSRFGCCVLVVLKIAVK